MKIAIITDYNNTTGVGSQNYKLYLGLKKLGVEVDIINLVSLQGFKEPPGYGINILSSVFGNSLLSFAYGVFYKFPRELKKILSKGDYTAVILGHQGMAYLSKPLAKLGISVSIVVHDLFSLYDYVHGLGFFIYNHLLLAGLRRIKNMVFISDFTKRDYDKYFNDLDKKNRRRIYQGIDVTDISPDLETKLISRFDLAGKYILLNVGTEDPRKNIKTFLGIAHYYNTSHKDMVFVRLGKPSKDSSRYMVDNYINNVLYTGWLSDEDMIALYKISNIVLSPSLLEGYGRQIFEGYLYDNFVVTTKISDVETLFQGDKNVFMVDDPKNIQEYVGYIDHIYQNKLVFSSCVQIQSTSRESEEYLQFMEDIVGG